MISIGSYLPVLLVSSLSLGPVIVRNVSAEVEQGPVNQAQHAEDLTRGRAKKPSRNLYSANQKKAFSKVNPQ